ncbi:MAG: TetR/AcrR family transcriptional regulator [Myxococcales bacterium]|nr:TetR/AcrR family transcriptional regulator [Myxococcales bacterium]MDP3505929.1 TetR/AcrR family transcriptional regulator [Myxococcales bacterium]
MGRATGTLNKDHHEARADLARKVAQHLLTTGGTLPSLSALALGAGVDPGTLRHYFVDRRGVVKAAMETLLVHGNEQKLRALALADLPIREALVTLLSRVAKAWGGMLGGMHATGFVEGMVDGDLGQTYVSTMLEPTLATVEALLERYRARNMLEVPDVRVSALALMSPVLLACFHQYQLQGRACRPLDLDAFVEGHVDGFLRGYAAQPSP